MANTRVGISTISDELLEHIRTEVKAVLNWSDLNDTPGYAGQGGKFLEAFSGGGDSGIQWSSLPPQGLSWINADADVTATDKIGYMAAGGITITLPANPVVGNLVAIADRDSSFAVSPVTVIPTGSTIEGDTDLVLDLRNAYIQLIFDGTQWQISQVNHPYNVNEITEEQHVFSAANNTRDITLSRQAPSRSSVIVIRNGSILSTTEYSLAGNVLTLNFVPRSETISVRHIGIPAATRVADVPVGFMGYFPNNNVPAGWLRTIGGTITRSMYPELVTFLTGNPAAEVATLPDSRGDFVRCYDFGAGTDTTQIPSQLIANELGRWMTTTFPGTTENLWDGNTSTTTTVNFADQAIGYSFDAPTVINSITLFNAESLGAQYLPSQIRLQYSDDGGVWFDASAVVPGNTNNALVTIASTELAAHRHWRVLGAGGLQHPNSDQYWTVATLQFFGTMQARVIGSQQGSSVGEMDLTVGGTPYGIGQVPTGAGTSALVANGTGVAAGGTETRPVNVSYVLCIKSSHYQNGELGTEDLNNVLTEIAQIRSEASDSRSYVQPTPPENPVDNARWYDTESGRTYIWFNDGNSYQWVDDSPQAAAQTAQAINAAEILSVGSTTPRALNERFADVTNVKDFGAVGDGVTDDTAAIQDAISRVDALGGTIFFPAGNYAISNPIILRGGVKYTGTSGGSSKIVKHPNFVVNNPDGHVMWVNRGWNTESSYNADANGLIQDISFDEGSHTLGSGDAIALGHAANWVVERCRFFGMRFHGVDITGSTNITVRDCFYFGTVGLSYNGFQADQATAGAIKDIFPDGTPSKHVKFLNNYVSGASVETIGEQSAAFHIHRSGNTDILIDGNITENCGFFCQTDDGSENESIIITNNIAKRGVIDSSSGTMLRFRGAVKDLLVSSNKSYGYNVDVYLGEPTVGLHEDILITDNVSNLCVNSFVFISKAIRVNISNNHVQGGSNRLFDYGVALRDCDYFTVHGNSIYDTTGVGISISDSTSGGGSSFGQVHDNYIVNGSYGLECQGTNTNNVLFYCNRLEGSYTSSETNININLPLVRNLGFYNQETTFSISEAGVVIPAGDIHEISFTNTGALAGDILSVAYQPTDGNSTEAQGRLMFYGNNVGYQAGRIKVYNPTSGSVTLEAGAYKVISKSSRFV